jgi:hypothetical protein
MRTRKWRALLLVLAMTGAAVLLDASPAASDPPPPARFCNFVINDTNTGIHVRIKWTEGWVIYAWLGNSQLFERWGGCQTGKSSLRMQDDGNLVLYDELNRPRWSSDTWQWWKQGLYAVYQHDGNLVVYNTAGQPVWASNTWGCYTCVLAVQADGNVVIYDTNRSNDTWNWTPIWATGTWH